ncbi:MAG: replication-associated recombination protein A, partial [Abditibacteriota bacterium]|nr:replication-associated recombination protein A [Abditibacteriota bacterium]
AGEDPKFVARRMIVQASEDIGNADPMAMVVASSAAQAVQFVGMPEAAIPLAHAAIYLACAPKSNACYMALARARKDLKNERTKEIPMHLRNPVFKNAKDFGIGVGYKYPHDFPGNYVKQEYMPKSPDFEPYYRPTENGHEAKIKARLERLKDMDGGGK